MDLDFQSKEHLLGASRENFREPEGEPFRESSEQLGEDMVLDQTREYMEPARERSEQLREARERARERREAATEHRDSARGYKGAAKLSRAQAKANREQARERRSSRKSEAAGTAANEPRRGPKSCSSHYKGVTKHRRTGRWEAHIWGRAVNKGPGKQIYLGGFVTPEEAAEAHDLAALQLQGPNAKTNFHISRYSEWLATLQATPSEDNLPLQLRRAGMFKRCSDRQKTAPPVGMHFAQPEPDTPLNTDAKARLSRASDSTQTVEVSPSNVQYFEREDSVNSQASGQGQGQGPTPSATLRKPMPVRYSMPPSSDLRAANGASNGMPSGPPAMRRPSRQASGGPQVLPSRSLPSGMMGGQGAAPYLNSRVVPQLVPIGWKSFEALAGAEAAQARAQAEAQMHAHARAQMQAQAQAQAASSARAQAQAHAQAEAAAAAAATAAAAAAAAQAAAEAHFHESATAASQIHNSEMAAAAQEPSQGGYDAGAAPVQAPPRGQPSQGPAAQEPSQGGYEAAAAPIQVPTGIHHGEAAEEAQGHHEAPVTAAAHAVADAADQGLELNDHCGEWLPRTAGSGFAHAGDGLGQHKVLGFLTPEQVRLLETHGVKFPENLQLPRDVPQPSSDALPGATAHAMLPPPAAGPSPQEEALRQAQPLPAAPELDQPPRAALPVPTSVEEQPVNQLPAPVDVPPLLPEGVILQPFEARFPSEGPSLQPLEVSSLASAAAHVLPPSRAAQVPERSNKRAREPPAVPDDLPPRRASRLRRPLPIFEDHQIAEALLGLRSAK